mmetsp:Transcript_1473/g.5579  ORF Transcript_1473/g.5579 Transcript_1473/m.5579 type:complete len:207 (-) Transcript_1473:419-1039(-)
MPSFVARSMRRTSSTRAARKRWISACSAFTAMSLFSRARAASLCFAASSDTSRKRCSSSKRRPFVFTSAAFLASAPFLAAPASAVRRVSRSAAIVSFSASRLFSKRPYFSLTSSTSCDTGNPTAVAAPPPPSRAIAASTSCCISAACVAIARMRVSFASNVRSTLASSKCRSFPSLSSSNTSSSSSISPPKCVSSSSISVSSSSTS